VTVELVSSETDASELESEWTELLWDKYGRYGRVWQWATGPFDGLIVFSTPDVLGGDYYKVDLTPLPPVSVKDYREYVTPTGTMLEVVVTEKREYITAQEARERFSPVIEDFELGQNSWSWVYHPAPSILDDSAIENDGFQIIKRV
jgi:hypothetical protein